MLMHDHLVVFVKENIKVMWFQINRFIKKTYCFGSEVHKSQKFQLVRTTNETSLIVSQIPSGIKNNKKKKKYFFKCNLTTIP